MVDGGGVVVTKPLTVTLKEHRWINKKEMWVELGAEGPRNLTAQELADNFKLGSTAVS